jgi:hypothetical protein
VAGGQQGGQDGAANGPGDGPGAAAALADLAGEHVRIMRPCGVNAQVKVACLVGGMIAGADSIDDLDLLRHGTMACLFGGVRAPSTLGSFLRAFTWGERAAAGEGVPGAAG